MLGLKYDNQGDAISRDVPADAGLNHKGMHLPDDGRADHDA